MGPAQPEIPLEKRVTDTPLGMFDPRRYVGTAFEMRGAQFQVYESNGQCFLFGRRGELGNPIPENGAEIIYIAGIQEAYVDVACALTVKDVNGDPYASNCLDLEPHLRPHREAPREGLLLMIYCELEEKPYVLITPPPPISRKIDPAR